MTKEEKVRILELLREGVKSKEIAHKLQIPVGRVRAVIAQETGTWAKKMTKYLIRKVTKKSPYWEIVRFEGKKGGEPVGIVDLVAIRKDFMYQDDTFK